MKSLRQQAKEAPKFIIELASDLYVAEDQGLTGITTTSIKTEALQYSIGFDSEETKVGYWKAVATRHLGLCNAKAINLV